MLRPRARALEGVGGDGAWRKTCLTSSVLQTGQDCGVSARIMRACVLCLPICCAAPAAAADCRSKLTAASAARPTVQEWAIVW